MLKQYFDEQRYEEIKANDNLFYKALEIVTTLFENDYDKGGYPYINHLIQVYKNVHEPDEKVIALLHDVIEDKNVNKDDLLDIGFPNEIVEDVAILSRDKVTEYQDYIDNLVKNASRSALHVKLSDLTHNMDLSRIKEPSEADYERIDKRYKPAYTKVTNRLDEMEK